MKKTFRFLSMAALALVGAVMTGCSNEDDFAVEPENKSNVVTLTTTVGIGGGAGTRALSIDYENKQAVKTFAAGETMAIVYKNKSGNTVKAVSSALKTTDIEDGSKSATFTFELTDPDKGEDVTYIYPAAMAGDDDVNFDALATQDGTQVSLSSTLDLATYSGAWNGDNLPAGTLHNDLAVLALTLKNGAGTKEITSTITGLTVSDGTNTYTVSRSAVAGPIYLAIRPTSGADIEVTATDGSKHYTKTLTSKTYAANNFYPLGWKLLTLIEWNQSELEGISSMYDNGSRTLKGVTLTKTSGTFYTHDFGKYFGGEFQFSTVLGKFTKIEVTTNYGSPAGTGWSGNVWTGTAANIVNIAESDFNATNIVFTIEEDIVAVIGITLNKTSTSIEAGQTETLSATILPAEATDKSVTWTSSDPSVATVDASGVVTAVTAGTATITASAGGYSATCEVTVTAPAAPEPEPEPSGDLTSFNCAGVTVYYVPGETWEQAENHSQNEDSGLLTDGGAVFKDGGSQLYWSDGDGIDHEVSSGDRIDPSKNYWWY